MKGFDVAGNGVGFGIGRGMRLRCGEMAEEEAAEHHCCHECGENDTEWNMSFGPGGVSG